MPVALTAKKSETLLNVYNDSAFYAGHFTATASAHRDHDFNPTLQRLYTPDQESIKLGGRYIDPSVWCQGGGIRGDGEDDRQEFRRFFVEASVESV